MTQEQVHIPEAIVWAETTGAGTPLVLCHGGPVGYDYLEPVAVLVDDLALVHRFDQRGGGRTVSAERPSLAALVADLEALRRHWRHERWIVAGHSWGAHLALFHALAHPARVAGLLLMNGPGIRWGWGPARDANRLTKLTPGEQRDFAERRAELCWLTDFADRATAQRFPRFDAYPRDRALVLALERDWEAALAGIAARVRALEVPALVVHGEADPMPAAGPRELAALLPQGEFVLLSGVGHSPWLEDAPSLRARLRDFVARCATTG